MASRLVVFTVDERRFGLPLSLVDRVVHAVEITPVPQAPAVVVGMINFQGRIIPVFGLRERLGLPTREVQITDQLVIARTEKRTVALLTDNVAGVEDVESTAANVPGPDFVEGVVQHHETLLLICDIERFLTGDEEAALLETMTAGGVGND